MSSSRSLVAKRLARRANRRQLGQTMVLGVVTLLVLAFMTMLSFNIANAIQQKIRLQSHSDAMAYSIAVVEARAFNYYAFSNRAIAAVLVAQSSLHAWHAIASTVGGVMWAAAISFFQIAAIEIALCCACPWCSCVWHCWDALMATIVAFRYIGQVNTWNNRVRGLESTFNNSVRSLGYANDMLHNSQFSMNAFIITRGAIGNAGSYGGVKAQNMPCASNLPMGLGALNVRSYACALEGTATDALCVNVPGMAGSDGVIGRVPRSKVITNVANAARPGLDQGHTWPAFMLLHPQFMNAVRQVPGEGVSAPVTQDSTGRITNGDNQGQCTTNAPNTEGSTACGYSFGLHGAWFRHGVGGMMYRGFVASNQNGGRHNGFIANPHSGTHNRFRSTQRGNNDLAAGCLAQQGNCFFNFRANPNSRTMRSSGGTTIPYYQQPVTYGAFSAPMTSIRDNCAPGRDDTPWQITNSGSVTVGDGARGQGRLSMLPTGQNLTARSLSKAMVYYHRFDDWKAAPNMFDPYWRAKLHPFDRAGIAIEAAIAAGAAGDTRGAANAVGPTEGVWP